MKHEHSGSPQTLEEVIQSAMFAVENGGLSEHFNILGIAQLREFDLTQSIRNSDLCISNMSNGLRFAQLENLATDVEDHNLCLVFKTKYAVTNDEEALNNSAESARNAVLAVLPDKPNFLLYPNNVGSILQL